MVNKNGYAEQSRIFLGQAYRELEQDDLRQASEKGWGAAAQIVKAAADARGLDHASHGLLFAAVRDLVAEAHEDGLRIQFYIANELHMNFYEGRMDRNEVASNLDQVSQFVDKVETLVSGPNGSQ